MNPRLDRRQFLRGSATTLAAVAMGPLSIASARANSLSRPTPSYGPAPGVAKLDANENPYGPSPAALEAMMAAGRQGAYYVSDSAAMLRAMIAERHGLTPAHVVLSSGSSGGLVAAAVMAGQKGDILGPDLFWDTTAMSLEQQGLGEVKRLPRDPGLAIDLAAMAAAIDDSTGMAHICNPNNPTGLLLDPAALRNFCMAASARTLVLVDEAYNELLDDPDGNSMIPLVKDGYNVIVARTFSKIYGLAGMRIGYLITTPEIAAGLNRFGLGWYGLNQAGIAAALACYEDPVFMAASRSKVREARAMVLDALAGVGLHALPSQANFLYVDLGTRNADTFRRAMAEQKVMIRGIYRDYTQWSRVSMGLLEDVERYTQVLPQVLDSLPA